jgi:hypothetical protein
MRVKSVRGNLANVKLAFVAAAFVAVGSALASCTAPFANGDAGPADGADAGTSANDAGADDAGAACVDDDGCTPGAETCCAGVCRAVGDARFCGCTPDVDASFEDCVVSGEICVNTSFDGNGDPVGPQSCLCNCSVSAGGPQCNPHVDAGDDPVCTCNTDLECQAADDAGNGRFRVVADSCGAGAKCGCNGGPVCRINEQCTSAGCLALDDDPENCGVVGNVCPSGDACVLGGCQCASDTDCTGANVDSCSVNASPSCVCAGYAGSPPDPEDFGVTSCPLGLACAPGGCVLDGVTFAHEGDLRSALGLPFVCSDCI